MPAAHARQQRARGDRADAGELHQAFAACVVAGGLRDSAVVFGITFIQPVCVGEQIGYAAVGVTRQVFQVCADLAGFCRIKFSSLNQLC